MKSNTSILKNQLQDNIVSEQQSIKEFVGSFTWLSEPLLDEVVVILI